MRSPWPGSRRRTERSQADQRGAVVTITSEGRQLMAVAAPQHVADVQEAVIDQLTPAELRTLTKITDKVRRRLAALDPELETDTQ
ncbi:hypothetical protein [Actinoplanes philippinensis]|uniref:hypothetical protein n=1 Tax=Actinoplanes philippinensis TaxID=35752 RepID=UPI0033C8B268